MFNNVGKKLQSIASLVFIVGIISSCILGVYVGFISYLISDDSPIFLVTGLLVTAICIFVSWVLSLWIYAYGKITESSEESARLLRQMSAVTPNTEDNSPPSLKCTQCGADFDDDAVFCAECGAKR